MREHGKNFQTINCQCLAQLLSLAAVPILELIFRPLYLISIICSVSFIFVYYGNNFQIIYLVILSSP